MLELILLYLLIRGAAEAWKETKAAWGKSRKAYMKRAKKHYPSMSKPQRAAHAARHDLGYGLSQLLHGFPTTRHGFAQGWSEGRQAHVQAQTAREKAATGHAEAHAGALAEWKELRKRRREAQEEIRRSRQVEAAEGSSLDDPAAHDYCPYCGTRDDEDCPPRCASWTMSGKPYPGREDGPAYSYGPESAAHGWPSATVEHAHEAARRGSESGALWIVTEYPAGGGQGRTVAAYRNGEPFGRLPGDDRSDDDWAASLPGENGYSSTGNPPPDCWLCGLPVDGDELGASAHQRCLEVNDRDMERTEIADGRDVDEVERDLRSRDLCPYQVEYGTGGRPRYCGQPILGDDDEFCPRHEAEAQGDWDTAAEEVHRRTRELLAQEPEDDGHLDEDDLTATSDLPEDEGERVTPAPGGHQASGSPTEGTTSMSDVTYETVTRDMGLAIQAAETRSAEVNASMSTAEQQAQDVTEAKTRASAIAEGMQALNVDPATLGAMADHHDALDDAEKAHRQVQEALEVARKASVRVQETAEHTRDALAQGQGLLAEAHADTAHAADNAFFENYGN